MDAVLVIVCHPNGTVIIRFSNPSFPSRRYRNCRLGEFLKELDLTEGRATGIPTIQDELKSNGSPQATIETDDARTYFLIDIPCHRDFAEETLSMEQIGVKDGVKDGVKENQNVTKDVTKELSERQRIILEMITDDSFVTISEMSLKTEVATRTIIRDLDELQAIGVIAREGGRKEGHWVIVTQSGSYID